MRPYLAVIYDSFHSALSSRILWVAFIAIWILLGALAPIGYREDFTTTFRAWDFDNGTQLKVMLAQGIVDPDQADQPLGRIAAVMPDELKSQLKQVVQGDVRIRTHRLADALNEILDQEDWYDAAAWKSTTRLKELRELDELPAAGLSDSIRRRRARLRIEAALPGVFEARSSRSILLTYAGADFPSHFAVGKVQFATITNQFALPILMNWLLGFVLIFLGILVTASIVPDMLQPGSLHLLLSKPISRSLLLISKFVGGCAFVLLCVCQLVGGLWLIAGLRLDIWNIRLLWCIPVAVFLFSVFYSVSLLAGLRWRSPILAIGITCMFGAFVLVIGFMGGYFDSLVKRPDRIRSVTIAGDDILANTRGAGLRWFDPKRNRWHDLIENDSRGVDLLLPLTKLDEDHLVTARIRGGRFNPYGSGTLDMLLLARSNDWEPEPGLKLPIATRRLYKTADDSLLAMNTGGLAETSFEQILVSAAVDGRPKPKPDNQNDKDPQADPPKPKVGGWLADLMRMRGGATKEFQSILPPGVTVVQPVRLVVSDDGQWLIVYSLGRVFRLEKPQDDADSKVWELTASRDLEGEAAQGTVIALSGLRLLVARSEEPPVILDAVTLETVAQFDLKSGAKVYSAAGLADGKRLVIVTNDADCQMVHVADGKATLRDTIGIDEVETVTYDAPSKQLIVAHHIDQIDMLDGDSLSVTKRIRPSLASWRFVDRFVISPIRMLTPQTGELGDTVSALVGGNTAVTIGQAGPDDGDVLRFKILRPVLSCAGFIVFMLSLSCLYFSRRDF